MTSIPLSPTYRVELSVENRQHFYDVFLPESDEREHRFAGVTGALKVIDKPALVNWAKREALALVETALVKRLKDAKGGPIVIDRTWIDALFIEAKERPDKIKDAAGDLGTRIHAVIDKIIRGGDPLEMNLTVDMIPAVLAFQEWWKNSGIELVMGDTKVASLLHKYGGSLDALGRRQGKFIILDWKTSNGIYPEYALQVAAYAQAFFETYGIYCQEGIIVRFGKKLPIDFETKTVRNLEASLQAFLMAKALGDLLKVAQFAEAI